MLCAATARAQEPPAPIIVHTATTAKLPEPVGEFTKNPPDITLIPQGEGARHGRVWVRIVGDGLLIAGEVDGGPPSFPQDKNEILAKDHVEVWLAASRDVDMPEVGWANYFGETTLPRGSDSCVDLPAGPQEQSDAEKKCRDWAERQFRYRRYLRRLFVRQWLVAPGFSIESFAVPAYSTLLKELAGEQEMYVNEGPRLLKPRGEVRAWISNEAPGYSFQILVPFSALPPLSSLKLSDLYLLVDVFGRALSGKEDGRLRNLFPCARLWRPQNLQCAAFGSASQLPFDSPQSSTAGAG